MRTITIQADRPLDTIMEQWLAHLVLAIPVGPDGIKFDGDLSNGTIVNQGSEGRWTVSFRPSPGGSRSRAYFNPYVVARVIIAGEHETVANLPSRDAAAQHGAPTRRSVRVAGDLQARLGVLLCGGTAPKSPYVLMTRFLLVGRG